MRHWRSNNLDRDFDYDAIYRLLSANGRENAPTITPIWDDSYRSSNDSITTAYTQDYSYDKLGNIQSFQHTGTSGFTRAFNYNATDNKLNSVDIGATNYAFTYDACGNQLTETSSRHWEWDSTDKPRCFYVEASGSITQYTQYLYDSGGKRVKKLTWKTGGTYDSISYIDSTFEYHTDGTHEQNILHIMDNRSRIAIIRIGDDFGDTTPALKYTIENFIGSSIVQLEDNGTTINTEEYYPFGETSFGSYAKKRYKYCGKERDLESGLYYYGARYYNAWTCRFISVDPMADKYVFQSSYVYGDNDPINKIDYNGEGTGDGKKSGDAGKKTTGGSTETIKPVVHNVKQELYSEFKGIKIGERVVQMSDSELKKNNIDKDKTSIYIVDDFAKGYSKESPWKTAKALLYEVGSKTDFKGITGKSFRDDHPLKDIGTKAGAQVYKEDLMKLGNEFWGIVKNGIPEFEAIKDDFFHKSHFQDLVTDDAKYDLKSTITTDGTPSYAAKVIGEWSFLNGRLTRYDDYGNIAYGVFGIKAGFTEQDLLSGSNTNQQWKDFTGKTNGQGDELRDKLTILIGINFANTKFK